MPESPFYYSLAADGRLFNEKQGVGFRLQGDRQPVINNISGMFTYRYRIKLNDSHSIRMALSAGLIHNSINLLNIDAQSPSESTLSQKNLSKAGFNVEAGLVYKFRDFELGFAALQLNSNSLEYYRSGYDNKVSYNLIRHFNASAKYRFTTGNYWHITPSAILYSTQGMPAYLLASCTIDYGDDYWLGIGYRSDKSLAVSAGMVISGRLNIGYSFEFPMNSYATHLGNTHEVTLGIRLFGRSGEPESRKSASRKDLEQLSEVIRSQSQEIDGLAYQNKQLKEEIDEQKNRFDSREEEIKRLIEQTVGEREEAVQAKTESVTPEQLDSVPHAGKERYLVIVGAYSRLEDAKLFQKILERELGLVTWVHARQSGKVTYLVYSRIVKTKNDALSEFDRLYDLDIERYKQGELWILSVEN
jgi:type IX secretion system PorP/SprF family membrane protein